MAQASTLTRLRTGDIRSIPVGLWPLLGLALADVYLRLQTRGSFLDLAEVPFLIVAAAPFVFAAAVVYAAPSDRRFVIGAVALAVPELLHMLELLFAPAYLNVFPDFEWQRLSLDVTWLVTLVGLLLIGRALGGISTRRAWAAVAVGVAIYVMGVAWYASNLAADPLPGGLPIPIEQVPISFLTGLVTVGWAYLLGAALDHGRRAIALGAGIIVGLGALTLIMGFAPVGPGTDYGFLPVLTTLVHLAAWVALIVGGLTEMHPKTRPESRTEPAAQLP